MRRILAVVTLLVLVTPILGQDCFEFADYLPVVFEDESYDCDPVTVDLVDGILYLDCVFDGLSLWDFSDPSAPSPLGTWGGIDYTDAAAVVGTHCFIAGREDGLLVVDCSDPAAPFTVAQVSTLFPFHHLEIQGDLAYVTSRDYGLFIYDISEPRDPVGMGAYPYLYADQCCVDGQFVYVTGYDDVRIFDVSDPGAPVLASTIVPLENNHFVLADDGLLFVGGSVGLGGVGAGRLSVLDVSDPAVPVELAVIDMPDAVTALARTGDLVLAATNETGLMVVDVADADHPRLVGQRRDISWTDDILITDDLAITAQFWDGWTVVDISQPLGPSPVGSAALAGRATGLHVTGDRTYVAGWEGGLSVVDTADPTAPQLLGAAATPGLAGHVAVQGDHAFVADHHAGLTVVDVSQPASPQVVGGLDTSGEAVHVTLSGALAYVCDGIGGVQVVDISMPTAPALVGNLDTPYLAKGTALQGSRLFVADGYGGLIMADATNPTAPVALTALDLEVNCLGVEVRNDAVLVLTSEGVAVVKRTEDDQLLVDEFITVDTPVRSFRLTEEHLYLGLTDGDILVYRYQVPDPLVQIGVIPARDGANDLATDGELLYVADREAGLTILPRQCRDITGVAPETPAPPVGVTITALAPNPFNPRTTCRFSLDRRQQVSVAVFDLRGRRVRELVRGVRAAGDHSVDWDGRDAAGRGVPSGVYLLQVRGDNGRDGRRISLIK